MAGMYCLNDLLKLAESQGAEELWLEPGHAPRMVVQGRPRPFDVPALTSDNVAALFHSFAGKEQLQELQRCGRIRFNHTFQDAQRFVVHASVEGENLSVKLKHLSR